MVEQSIVLSFHPRVENGCKADKNASGIGRADGSNTRGGGNGQQQQNRNVRTDIQGRTPELEFKAATTCSESG
jgi:hypothetical protein